MRKFKLNNSINNEPTKEQINRHKDFARLHHDYEKLTKRSKKPLYRDPRTFLLLFLIAIILLLLFLEDKA